MKDSYSHPLTDEQRQQLKLVLDNVDQALDQLDSELARMGRPPEDENITTLRCLVPGCTCKEFKPRGHSLQCATPGCGHRFTRHDVF